MMIDDELINRFNRRTQVKIIDSNGCYLWQGAIRNAQGYGYLVHNSKRLYVHRVSWSIANGTDVPTGLVVRHRCDVPLCYNPKHLLIGTHADNTRDMMDRGRQRGPLPPRTDNGDGTQTCRNGHMIRGTQDLCAKGIACRQCKRDQRRRRRQRDRRKNK